MLIGYALKPDELEPDETSELDQQFDKLVEAGVDPERIYEDEPAPNKVPRPQLGFCFKALREGDVLVVLRLERLGRSMQELIEIIQGLESRKVDLRCLSEGIDTSTPDGKNFFKTFGAVAQFERDIISERTKAGLRAARAKGRRGGRRPKIGRDQVRIVREMMQNTELKHEEIADHFGVSRATLYRAIERDDAEREAELQAEQETEDRKEGEQNQSSSETEQIVDLLK